MGQEDINMPGWLNNLFGMQDMWQMPWWGQQPFQPPTHPSGHPYGPTPSVGYGTGQGVSGVQTGGEGGQEFSQQDYMTPTPPWQPYTQIGDWNWDMMNALNPYSSNDPNQEWWMDNPAIRFFTSMPHIAPEVYYEMYYDPETNTTGHPYGATSHWGDSDPDIGAGRQRDKYEEIMRRRADAFEYHNLGQPGFIGAENPFGGSHQVGYSNIGSHLDEVGAEYGQSYYLPYDNDWQWGQDYMDRFGGGYGLDANERRTFGTMHGISDVWAGDVMRWVHDTMMNDPSWAQDAGWITGIDNQGQPIYDTEAMWESYRNYGGSGSNWQGRPDTYSGYGEDYGDLMKMQNFNFFSDMTGGLSQSLASMGFDAERIQNAIDAVASADKLQEDVTGNTGGGDPDCPDGWIKNPNGDCVPQQIVDYYNQ